MNQLSIPLALVAVALLLLPGRAGAARRLAGIRGLPHKAVRGGRVSDCAVDPLGAAGTLDLFAACLRAGLPAAAAAGAVAAGAPEPMRGVLRRAADLLLLGADPLTAWEQASVGCTDETVGALVRMVRRSARSGAGLAAGVGELAEQRRAAVEDAAVARAERAGVLISGPLGLCFLPAFVCLGIVPVVIGLAGHVLGDGLL
ncbi:type II secretion system F family protein [Nocardia huaxiensis]|uniref:Type II secretion system F family protein n=1 Tax=Nocardia huaxiensis TaxID=2755382 RepID=A0A7D6ZDY1_9NOCA|nr:type II secretion system F family protein [Nocardia huaxiensis]QLY31378.1 type II secretion system F family protein [Nocardia huaxiensis]UFS94924.1 type II secretion system F family protein [Nocardia huaxiensis]